MGPGRRQTIANRLYLVGALAILSVAALAAASVYFAVGTRRAADGLYAGGIVRAVEASELELLLERHRRLVAAAAGEFDREQLLKDKQIADVVKERIERLVQRSRDTFAAEVLEMFPSLWATGDDAMRLAESFAHEQALAVVKQYVAKAEMLQELIRAYRQSRVATARQETRTLSERAGMLVRWVIVIAVLASLLIGPLGVFLLRSMVIRLERITAAMRRLARQDTSVDLGEIASGDEIGEMAKAVSVFKQNAVQLQQLNRWLDIALNNMTRGISMFDASQRLVICNSVYQRIYDMPDNLAQPGVPFGDIVRHRERIVASVDGREAEGEDGLPRALVALIERRREGLARQRLKNGRTIEVSVKSLPWGGWVALHEDVTERITAAEKITRLARQDTLTGLANRFHFREGLETAIGHLEGGSGFALIAIDLDRFKEVNDALGHPAGDAPLAIIGRRLTELARRGDMVARLGGDEFAIIQRNVADRSAAEALARRVIKALHRPILAQGKRVEIGATVGIAMAPADARSAEDLMRKADMALYRAKSDGRGTWRFYDPDMEGRIKARRQLEIDLGGAVARGQLELVYQPIVSLAARRVEGCEALLRWRHPERGMVSPAEFIPVAEETGLICGIGAWALAAACRAAASWPDGLFVSVNLSVAQFSGPDLACIAGKALDDSGLHASRLELEVTESLLLGDDPATYQLLHRLRNLGVSVALDDFGTGYSSLSHLRRFPFDKIKIDQSFVRELPQRRNCEAIVGAVARLASSLDMTTVAEGVETVDHLERVEAAGCNFVQGYLFSRPVPPAELPDVVREIDARLAGGSARVA